MSRDGNREKCRVVHDTCQNTEETEVEIHEFDVVISKMFNFHGIRSVILAKLKTKSKQGRGTCKYRKRYW